MKLQKGCLLKGGHMSKEIINEDNIILQAEFSNKWDAIKACGKILVKQGYVAESYIDDMLERERVATVYIGNQLAIPHGIANSECHIFHSGISFIQIPQGVSFGEDVAYIMIGIAGKDGTHIDILSNIALACCEVETVELLRNTSDKKFIIDTLSNVGV